MSISLLPEFDADGYQIEPSTAKLNEIITAVNESGGGGGGDTILSLPIAPSASALAGSFAMIGYVPVSGTVTSALWIANDYMPGDDTNTRTLALRRFNAGGGGVTTIATLAFVTGVTTFGIDQMSMTLSATPADLVVSAGQSLGWAESTNGTGLSNPGGVAVVIIEPS